MFSSIPVPQAFALLSLVTFVHGWQYGFPQAWNEQWPEVWQARLSEGAECTVSHLTAFEMAKDKEAISFSINPLDDFEAPRIMPLNSTVTEQWEFDGVSDDGMVSFIFGFYRDPGLAILGSGNLRVSAEFTYANRTRYGQVDYASDSIVEQCPEGTRGTWKTDEYSYSFEISKDMSRARIGIDTPDLKGNILIRSRMPPAYADGSRWPTSNATTAGAPYFHWVAPIPAGTVAVDLTVKGEPFGFTGMGGHMRLWSPFSWFTCLQGMNAVRTTNGPYSLFYASFTSNIKKGAEQHSVLLAKNGKPIFSTTKSEVSDTEDYVLMTKTYGGSVAGTLRDKVTGYELELVSPATNRHYTFIIEHKNIAFEYLLGGGRGGSGFSCLSIGGPIGLEQSRGIAFTEALNFPERSPLFKVQYKE
ncbi:MAG: hypothetical protein M1839_002857 [Geoglossum umbratile]|nr:MAG: hypothetical protein M1839_002857 [Geoglossum umbratile]